MDHFDGLIISALVVMVLLLCYYYKHGFSALSRIPAKEGGQVVDGETVRVRGIVQLPGKRLVAPLSGRTCALYEVIVTQYWNRGELPERVGYSVEEIKAGDLVMLCEDGTWVVIETGGTDNNIGNEYAWTHNFWSLDKEAHNLFLRKYGKTYDPVVALGERLRSNEKVILAGDILWAAGKAEWRNASELKFDLPVTKYLHIVAPEGRPVKLRNFEVY